MSWSVNRIMKRKFNQWWSTIPPISTKRTITSHFNSLNSKKGLGCNIQNDADSCFCDLCTWIPLLCYRTCSFQYETAICDVMVRLACSSQSSVVNRWFWALSGQTHQTKDWLVRNQDNLPEWSKCLPADCCFNELAL
jgi:hypothetical protein